MYQPDSKSTNQESKSQAEIPQVQTGNGTVVPELGTVEGPEIAALQCNENQTRDKADSVRVGTEVQDVPLPEQGNISLGNDHTVPKETQEDEDSAGEKVRTDNISHDTTGNFPIDVIVKVVRPVEHKGQNFPTKTETVREGKRKTKSRRSQKSSQKHATLGSDHHLSQPVDITDPASAPGTSPIIKFGNILDSCTADDTEVVVPKPKVVKPSGATLSHTGFGQGTGKLVLTKHFYCTVLNMPVEITQRYSFKDSLSWLVSMILIPWFNTFDQTVACGLLLELHALTLATRSYVFLIQLVLH